MNLNKIASYLSISLLILAIFNMPIGYYTFLRLAISISSAFLAYKNYIEKNNLLAVGFIIVLCLFNPIFTVYFWDKGTWIIIDLIVAVLFFINSRNASFENMYNLINFVKSKVKEKTGISLELELEIIN